MALVKVIASVPFKLDDGKIVPAGAELELEEDVVRNHAGLVQPVLPPAEPAA